MTQIRDVDIGFSTIQHRGGYRQHEVVQVGVDGEEAGTAGAAAAFRQLLHKGALVAHLRGRALGRKQAGDARAVVRAAQGDHPVDLAGQAQVFQGVAGKRATHGVADDMGFLRAGGGEDALHMVVDLLGQFASVDVRRGVAHRVHIPPTAPFQPPLHEQEVGAVTAVAVHQNHRGFPMVAAAHRRGVVDQPQRVAEYQHGEAGGFLDDPHRGRQQTQRLLIGKLCLLGKAATVVEPAHIEQQGDGHCGEYRQRQKKNDQTHPVITPLLFLPTLGQCQGG